VGGGAFGRLPTQAARARAGAAAGVPAGHVGEGPGAMVVGANARTGRLQRACPPFFSLTAVYAPVQRRVRGAKRPLRTAWRDAGERRVERTRGGSCARAHGAAPVPTAEAPSLPPPGRGAPPPSTALHSGGTPAAAPGRRAAAAAPAHGCGGGAVSHGYAAPPLPRDPSAASGAAAAASTTDGGASAPSAGAPQGPPRRASGGGATTRRPCAHRRSTRLLRGGRGVRPSPPPASAVATVATASPSAKPSGAALRGGSARGVGGPHARRASGWPPPATVAAAPPAPPPDAAVPARRGGAAPPLRGPGGAGPRRPSHGATPARQGINALDTASPRGAAADTRGRRPAAAIGPCVVWRDGGKICASHGSALQPRARSPERASDGGQRRVRGVLDVAAPPCVCVDAVGAGAPSDHLPAPPPLRGHCWPSVWRGAIAGRGGHRPAPPRRGSYL